MERTGKCLCGAVKFTAKIKPNLDACHCGMCRRWSGGVLLSVGTEDITWQGEGSIKRYASSEWAERAFCSECGSNLFYRLTAEGKYHGNTFLMVGTLDDPSGLELQTEWFIDRKPEAYALAGSHKTITEAEAFALLTGGN